MLHGIPLFRPALSRPHRSGPPTPATVEVWTRSGNLMLAASVLISGVLWVIAGWAIQNQLENNYTEPRAHVCVCVWSLWGRALANLGPNVANCGALWIEDRSRPKFGESRPPDLGGRKDGPQSRPGHRRRNLLDSGPKLLELVPHFARLPHKIGRIHPNSVNIGPNLIARLQPCRPAAASSPERGPFSDLNEARRHQR